MMLYSATCEANTMNAEHQEEIRDREPSRWETCAILFWGAFGTKTAAERRYIMRSLFAAAVVAAWVGLAFSRKFPPGHWVMIITLLVVGALMTYIPWEMSQYLRQLDELARRMQLEAIAWTYLTGMVVAGWFGVLLPLGHLLLHWSYPRQYLLLSIPFLYFLLEPVRAGWLYYLSRRY
jgi:hypothetical protein